MPSVLSIFSGGGGIDCGFANAGFDICMSTDSWRTACDTLEKNRIGKLVVCDDIRDIDYANSLKTLGMAFDDVDVLAGGPPCPAYSKSRFWQTEKKRALDDENSFTLYEYFRALDEVRPRVFFFENVSGFLYKPHRAAFDLLTSRANEYGYDITYKVVNTANYGVPQTRERFLCVGVRRDFGKPFVFPRETHFNPLDDKLSAEEKEGKKPWVTCADAIGDLDIDLPGDEDLKPGSKHKDLLPLVPPGDNYLYFTAERGYPNPIFKWRSRYWTFLLKLTPDRPSWTIQASFSNNTGPFHWKNRWLRIGEIKRLQTFADEYQLCGDMKEQWRQVGNAVPVLMAQVVATAIMDQYFKKDLLNG